MDRSKIWSRLPYRQIRQWIPFGESKRGIAIAIFTVALAMVGFAVFVLGIGTGDVADKDIITVEATLLVTALIATGVLLARIMYRRLYRLYRYDKGAQQREKSELEQYRRTLRRHGNAPEIVDRRLLRGEKPHLGADGEMVFDRPFHAGHSPNTEHHEHHT